MNFDSKSLNVLELNTVLNLLSNEAVCSAAKQSCRDLTPMVKIAEVVSHVEETTSAYNMLNLKGSPPFSDVRDINPFLDRAKLGGSLNTLELLDIKKLLRTARLVRSYIDDDKLTASSIDYLFRSLRANKYLEDRIDSCILGEDEISDNASPFLSDIRRKIRSVSANARESLQKIISSPSYSKALQENIVTMRSGRYVVPVKAEHRSEIPGIVHDMSASGATLFVEPMATVKANNELRELYIKEKLEIDRILSELSSECAEHSSDISSDYSVLVSLDVIFAKAKYSFNNKCNPAHNSSKGIDLKRARHPLLDKSSAVPIDVVIGEEYDTLIITGPNTGGKTVSLKTVGLLCAMNQCGLHIPADYGSRLPVFTHILADIGDEQSIEQSLSTFSSHMQNIVSIIDECDDNSLVLFDELGAGTDPTEGAALAVAIIENIRKTGAYILATTHYTELKVYAINEPGIQNASCEFDVNTLKPTYKLLIGIPGKSNAFAISKRLGLSDSIIDDAKSRVSNSNVKLEHTIEKLELARLKLENDRVEIQQLLESAKEKERAASKLKAEHEVKLEKAEIKAKREAESILQNARNTMEQVFEEIDEMKKHINEEEDFNKYNEARNELRRRLNIAEDSVRSINYEEDNRVSSRPIQVGDYVEIKKIRIKGEVLCVNPDHTIQVKSGAICINSKEEDVLLLEDYKPSKKTVSNSNTVKLNTSKTNNEIDLRGMDTIDGVSAAEMFIDSAVMNHLDVVSIIHGKGTGALRAAIHKMLKMNKNVKSFRLGTFGEGESGVTIVNIK